MTTATPMPAIRKPERRYIKRPRTPLQKKREMVLVVLDVEKAELAQAIGGTSAQVISNLFTDRHRSPDVEKAVVDLLNRRLDKLPVDGWDRDVLADLGAVDDRGRLTRESMGWPMG
jgi:hypothetical protein